MWVEYTISFLRDLNTEHWLNGIEYIKRLHEILFLSNFVYRSWLYDIQRSLYITNYSANFIAVFSRHIDNIDKQRFIYYIIKRYAR